MTALAAAGPGEPAPDVSVVLPVFRNRTTLEELHARLSTALADAGLSYELLFVDDACPDGSAAVLERLAGHDPRLRVLTLSRNVGQQRAVWTGLAASRGVWSVAMDADLQDPPESITSLLGAATPGVDAVLAAWHGRYEGPGRLVTSRAFKTLRERLTGYPRDAGMFFALRRPLVDEIVACDLPHPFLPSHIGLSGRRFVTVPVARSPRPDGVSAYSTRALVVRAAREVAFILRRRWSG